MACDVLVLDDDELVLEVTVQALEDAGYVVQMAEDATAALDFLTGKERCRLVLTDINLGEKQDGFAVVQIAREGRPDIKAIYYSGLPSNWHDRTFGDMDRRLNKPFTFEELLQAVQSLGVWPSLPPMREKGPVTL